MGRGALELPPTGSGGVLSGEGGVVPTVRKASLRSAGAGGSVLH